MKKSRFRSTISATVALLIIGSGAPLGAQKGQGGPSSSAGGSHGAIAAPGQTGGASNPGISSKPPGGTSGASHGRAVDPKAASDQKSVPPARTSADQLASNPKLSDQLQKFFPAGTNLSTEAAGFKNLGDFVAAAHVSNNLGIPFGELKGKLMNGKSLGQAIHELKPDVSSNSEASRAQIQAKKTLHDSAM